MDVTAEKLNVEMARNQNKASYVEASWPLSLAKLSCELEDLTDLQDAYMEAKRLYAEAVLCWADEVARTAIEKTTSFNPFSGGRPAIQIRLGKVTGQGHDPTLEGALITQAAPGRPWQAILPPLLEELYDEEGQQLADLLLGQPAAALIDQQASVADFGTEGSMAERQKLAELRREHLVDVLRRAKFAESARMVRTLEYQHFLADQDATWRGRLVRMLQEMDADEAANAVVKDSYIPVELTWGRLLMARGQLETVLALVR